MQMFLARKAFDANWVVAICLYYQAKVDSHTILNGSASYCAASTCYCTAAELLPG